MADRFLFSVLTQEYEKRYLVQKSASHIYRERTRLSTTILPFFGEFNIKDITQHTIKDFIYKRREQGVSNKTIRIDLTTVSCILNYAIDEEMLIENPVRKINQKKLLPKMPTRVGKYIEDKDLRRFFEYADEECALIVKVLRQTGMRCGELFPQTVSLPREKFDTERGILNLKHTIDTPIKSKKDRIIPLTKEVVSIVKRVPAGPIFKLNRHGFKTAFYRALKRSKVKFTPHDLRHTFTSVMVASGVDIKTLSTITGHSSMYIMDRYIHLVQRDLTGLRAKMDVTFADVSADVSIHEKSPVDALLSVPKLMETRGIEPLDDDEIA